MLLSQVFSDMLCYKWATSGLCNERTCSHLWKDAVKFTASTVSLVNITPAHLTDQLQNNESIHLQTQCSHLHINYNPFLYVCSPKYQPIPIVFVLLYLCNKITYMMM